MHEIQNALHGVHDGMAFAISMSVHLSFFTLMSHSFRQVHHEHEHEHEKHQHEKLIFLGSRMYVNISH